MSDDIKIYIGGVETSVLIDSGATCNILDGNTWNSLKQNKIKCKTELTDVKIQGYSQNGNLKVLGKLKHFQLHIPLNNKITPVIQPLRRVPIALQEKADKKLQQMELDAIIEKVEHPTN
ncbi:hypothetical protein ILUMI_16760 [Ignelater luminosus]|uniref:Retropepsins domain-containing protein n=1 Tax=Ignelater luminosus TaxID=2038154 RepID=A0A8K0CQD6_IGNLU|nr:hypothetical protein ILUMI_16760 [Ignelater luminosus]